MRQCDARPNSRTPTLDQVERVRGVAVLEIGTPWCGHYLRAQPLIEKALAQRSAVQHFKIDDGKGKPLESSYSVRS